MKRCPECRRNYYDDSLIYCLDDGTALLEGPASEDEPATEILPGDREGSRRSGGEELPTRTYVDKQPDRSSAGVSPSRRRIYIRATLITLIIAAGFLAFRFVTFTGTKQINSIAVMPFSNATGDANLEYLSDGITETLIGALSQIPDLNVKARSSVFRYKSSDKATAAIGKELAVDAVLNGRIVRRGNELTLYVELVDAATENSLWTRTYAGLSSNLVTTQNEIARDVAEKLQLRLSGAEEKKLSKNYTENAEAYRLYLLGRFHWNRRTKTDIYKAIDYYQRAVAVDPTYALAYSGLADAHVVLQGYDAEVSARETAIKAKEYALKALSLDDSLSEAHASVGLVLEHFDHDFAGAEREFKRAIELDPNNAANYVWHALLLAGLGRFDEGEAHCRRAIEIEPASPNINRNYGQFLQVARRYDESVEQLKRTIDLDPTFVLSYQTLGQTYMLQGRHSDSVEQYTRARELLGDREQAELLRRTFAAGGWPQVVRAITDSPEQAGFRPKYIRATLLLTIGENDRAIEKLEEAYEERETFLTFINVDPRLDALRGDPRFLRLQEKIGVPK